MERIAEKSAFRLGGLGTPELKVERWKKARYSVYQFRFEPNIIKKIIINQYFSIIT